MVYRPMEKGHTENLVGYARRNFLVPVPELDDFEAFNAGLVDACREELQSTLEDWIMIKLRHGDQFDVIDGIDINPQPEHAEADQTA